MSNFYDSQLRNRNYLSPVGFKLVLAKKEKLDFFSSSATVPGLTLQLMINSLFLNIPSMFEICSKS